jgi:CubicO group peptidase (beta-lactamase class C family)
MRSRTSPFTWLALGLSLAGLASAASPKDTEERIRAVQQLAPLVLVAGETPTTKPLADRMAELKVPGVSIAVIHQGRIDWARGFGHTSAEGGKPVTDQTLFQAASISKPVFALAVLHQVDAGKLNLDANINDYLKSWKLPDNEFTSEQKVTLRRLLSHSAGLTGHGFPGYESNSQVPTTLQILDGAPPANTAPIRVDIPPGSRHRYSGGGYTLAQLMLEDVTGVPLPKLLRESVLMPLGMALSSYEQPLPANRDADVAQPYRSDGKPVGGGPHIYPEMAAAGLWTTPSDLARYALGVRAALAGKSKVITAVTARAMLTPVVGDHGMGPVVGGGTARKYFTHGGSNAGYRCLLVAYEDGEGAIVMTNSDSGGELMGEVMRTIAHVYQWPDFAPVTRKLAPVKPELLERFVGVYGLDEGSTFVVRKDGPSLVGVQLGNKPVALFPSSDRELFARDINLVVSFTLDEKGAVTAIRHQVNGRERAGARADDARSRQVMATVEAIAKRYREQKPRAETEGALRELITGIAAGQPNYERMTAQFADRTRQQLPGMRDLIGNLGAIRKLTFRRVGSEGGDVFDVEFEKDVLHIDLRFSDDNRIDYVRLLPN